MRLHIFDVDHTIVGCSTVREFVVRGLREGLVGPSIGFYMPLLFLRYGLAPGGVKEDGRSYPFLRGAARGDLETLARSIFEDRLLPRIHARVVERIASIRRAGGELLIASSSFRTILEPLAAHLGIDDIVASELEFLEGRATGRISGEPAFGQGKRRRVLAHLEARGIDPADCSFYSDGWRDLPLLQVVGEAVAVNPGRALRRHARGAGWEILTTGPVPKEPLHA